MRKAIALILGLCMVLLLAACAAKETGMAGTEDTTDTTGDTILVGCILPLSGTSAYDGESAMNGAKAAAKYLNDNGGVAGGRKIKLLFEDSATDPATAASAAEKLIHKDGVKVLIGAFTSSCTAAVQPVAETNKIPLITAIATSEALTKHDCRYFFRAVGISRIYIDAFAGKTINDLGAKRIAYIYENGDWGRGSVESFKAHAEQLGAETATVQVINQGDADLYTQLTAIKDAKPDVIYAVSDLANAVRIATQKRELGIGCPMIGEGSWSSGDFLEQAGSAGDGIYGMVEYLPDISTNMNAFFKEQYGIVTDGKTPDKYAACEFNAVLVAANGIGTADDPDVPATIRDALAHTEMEILTGPIRFDGNGQGYGFEAFLSQNRDGKAVCAGSATVALP